MLIRVLGVAFALVAIRRAFLRYKRRAAMLPELISWVLVFGGIGVVVFIPRMTDPFAQWMGVSTGFNALTFLSILGLLFLVFQLIGRVQSVERDLTRAVRHQALREPVRVSSLPVAEPLNPSPGPPGAHAQEPANAIDPR